MIFCTELSGDSETNATEYGMFMHEAEVFVHPLVNAVEELRQALVGRYKITMRDQSEYDTSSDPEEARRIIEQARTERDEGSNDPFRSRK